MPCSSHSQFNYLVWSTPATVLEWELLQVYSPQDFRTAFLHVTYKLDTLFNHMAGIDSGTGVDGSTFTHYNYPGIYQNQDFHHCGLEPGDDIVNYDNRVEVQTCELVNLAEWVVPILESQSLGLIFFWHFCFFLIGIAWRLRQIMWEVAWQNMRMIYCRLGWMGLDWMLPNVG